MEKTTYRTAVLKLTTRSITIEKEKKEEKGNKKQNLENKIAH